MVRQYPKVSLFSPSTLEPFSYGPICHTGLCTAKTLWRWLPPGWTPRGRTASSVRARVIESGVSGA
jgi:hypothetical protein